MDSLVGQHIGRYRILEQIGSGGMAVVYKAEDTHLGAPVALKVIQPGILQKEKFLKRFEREARTLARLSHPNIVRTFDFGVWEGMPYFVMTYVGGGTLKGRMTAPMQAYEAAQLLIPVALALHSAHQQGITHRDVKPSNILMTEGGDPMLSDFGVARLSDGEEHTQLTSTGMGVGTPDYMAPEQWEGKAGPASDQYALGVLFYEMVTGKRPFSADTPVAVMRRHVMDAVPSARQMVPGLPREVDAIIARALAKRPEKRYPDMAALANALKSVPPKKAPVKTPRVESAPAGWTEKDKAPLPASAEVETREMLPEKVGPTSHRPLPWKWIGIGGGTLALVLVLALVLPGLMPGKGTPTPAAGRTNVAGVQTQSGSTAAPVQQPTAIPATLTVPAGSTTNPSPAAATTLPAAAATLPTAANTLAATAAVISYKEAEMPVFNQALASQVITAANLGQVRPLGVARLRSGAFPGSGPYGLAFNTEEWLYESNLLIAPTALDDPANAWDLENGRPGSLVFHVQSDANSLGVMRGPVGGINGPALVSLKDGSVSLVDQRNGKLGMNTVVQGWQQGAEPYLRVLNDGKRVAIGGGTKGWILSLPALHVLWSYDFSADWKQLLNQKGGKTLDQAYYADNEPAVRDISPDGNEWFLDAVGYSVQNAVWTLYSTRSRRASVSADGIYLVTGDTIWVREGKSPLPAKQLYEQNYFSPDGQLIVSTGEVRLRLASTKGSDAAVELASLETPSVGIAWSPNRKYFAVQEQSGAIIFYGIPWKGSASAAPTPAGSSAAVGAPEPGGQKITTANASSLRVIQQLKSQYGDPVKAVTFSPDGRLVAAGTGSGRVNVWSVADGRLIYSFPGLQAQVLSVAFSNSSALLAAGGDDNIILVWEVATGREIIRGNAEHPTFLKFLQGDEFFVIGGKSNGVLVKVRTSAGLWNSATYHLKDIRNHYLQTLPADQVSAGLDAADLHVDDVAPTGLVWYADGISFNIDNQAVIAFDDRLYYKSERDRSRAILAERNILTPSALYLPNGGKLRDLPNGPLAAMPPIGSTLFTFMGEKGISLGDVEDAGFHFDLPGSPGSVNNITFANDGKHLAACDEEGNVWIWGVP